MGRQPKESTKNKITWHLNDLLARDINVAYDCTVWLQPNQRDINRKQRPKRHAARFIAASMIVQAVENPAFAREVLDRSEGKVAEVLISGSFDDLIKSLEAGRARLLQPQAAIEGELASLPIGVDSASPTPEESHPVTDSTESTTTK